MATELLIFISKVQNSKQNEQNFRYSFIIQSLKRKKQIKVSGEGTITDILQELDSHGKIKYIRNFYLGFQANQKQYDNPYLMELPISCLNKLAENSRFLTTLVLQHCKVTPKLLSYLCRDNWKFLIGLNLSNNHLPINDFRILRKVQFAYLQILESDYNFLDNRDIQHICHLICPRLKRLSLYNNCFTSEGAITLARHWSQSLQSVQLSGNFLSFNSLRDLLRLNAVQISIYQYDSLHEEIQIIEFEPLLFVNEIVKISKFSSIYFKENRENKIMDLQKRKNVYQMRMTDFFSFKFYLSFLFNLLQIGSKLKQLAVNYGLFSNFRQKMINDILLFQKN